MPALGPAALAISVVLSALGAVTLCVLVVLYGFTPAGEERPRDASRRLLITRVGHALAAACFTATAILIAMVLAQPSRTPAVVTPADTRAPALGARLEEQQSRLAQTEARLKDLESALRRSAADGRPAAVPTPERVVVTEPPATKVRAVAPPHPTSRRRPPADNVAGVAPRNANADPVPPVVTSPPVVSPAPVPAPAPSVNPAPVVMVEPPRPAVTAPPTPDADAPAPAASPMRVAAPTPASGSVSPTRRPWPETPSPAAAPATTTASRRQSVEVAPPAAAPPRFDLRTKLREDWNAVRRGFESGEEDFRRALDTTKRNFRALFAQ